MRDIWNQHAAILDAVASGNARQAETLARGHITQAANFMVARLRSQSRTERAGQNA